LAFEESDDRKPGGPQHLEAATGRGSGVGASGAGAEVLVIRGSHAATVGDDLDHGDGLVGRHELAGVGKAVGHDVGHPLATGGRRVGVVGAGVGVVR
jgi:hypothetical protein